MRGETSPAFETVSMGIGVFVSVERLSKGIDVMTPAVIDRPLASQSVFMSSECTDDRFECLEERDPPELPGGTNVS